MSQEMEVARYNIYKAKRDLDIFAEETKKVRHSKNLTLEVVENIIMNSMSMVENLAKRYQEMAKLKEKLNHE